MDLLWQQKLCNLQQLKNQRFHIPQPTFLFFLFPLSMHKSKNRYFYHIFVSPGDAPRGNHAKCCMDGKRIRCLQIVSQHVPSICNSFPVIRTASAKNRCFHVSQPTFLFPLETPLRLPHNMLHGWKDNSMLAKPLAACTYLSSIVSELYSQCVSPKIGIFTTFWFPLGTPLGQSR